MNSKEKLHVVFGVSEHAEKYGHKIFMTLLEAGYNVEGINPNGGYVGGRDLYKSLSEVPGDIDTAIMVIPPSALIAAVEACIARNVRLIYFQPGAQSADAFNLAVSAGIKAVEGCYMVDNALW